MAGIAYGTIAAARVSLGTSDIKKISLGTATIWQSYSAMGIDKNASTQSITLNTWTTITGRVIRSGYPDTVITSDGIVVPAGVTVALVGQNRHSGSHAGNSCRLYNATTAAVIATSSSGATATPSVSTSYTPLVDSTIVVQAIASLFGTISAGSNTYLTVTP